MQRVTEDLIRLTRYEPLGELPNPFLFNDGTPVKKPEDWPKRRKEIFDLAVTMQYGTLPPAPEFLDVEPLFISSRGRFWSYRIVTGTRANPVAFTMMVRLPAAEGKHPAVITGDMCFGYAFDKDYLNAFYDNDVAFVMFNRTEIVPDHITEPLRSGQLYRTYPDCTFGALAAWAWGYSRCVDALEKLDIVDMDCIAFTGHSRGGKTAQLAGAIDERAAIVNPNDSGCCGAGCYRLNAAGVPEEGEEARNEMLADLTKNFPHWMGPEMRAYCGREAELPFDEHYMKALIAPRVLFVSEATSDMWANPLGSWQTTMAAQEVFRFLGCEENLLWYYRRGGHAQNAEDLAHLMNVVRHVKYSEPLMDTYFETPFAKPEKMFSWKRPE